MRQLVIQIVAATSAAVLASTLVLLAQGTGTVPALHGEAMAYSRQTNAWIWDGNRWEELALAGAPDGRAAGALAATAEGLLYVGGYGNGLLAESWLITRTGWRRLD